MPRSHLGLVWAGLLFAVAANAQEPQELTRGPIHEAFGQPTTFDPEAGPIVPKAPPEAVDELPPDQRPEGDNIGWITGYWAYDDEDTDFLWVSGFWRTIPPGRTWVPGYWAEAEGGHQWVSGFWQADKQEEVEYLPPPPESLENGPSTEPAENQVWSPGCWIWRESRYWWRPGGWVVSDPGWLWVPAHYEWTPHGYVFIDGYWDYPLERRGLLFAPVRFVGVRPGFVYRPAIVLDTPFLTVSLFARPRYAHYYFGDYYAPNYATAGIYPWYAFHNSRWGYDPLYAHSRAFYGRRDARWEANIRAAYIERRDTVGSRPPRTFAAYAEWSRRGDGAPRTAFARPLSEATTARDFSVKTVKVEQTRVETIKKQITQTRTFQAERVRVEKDRTVRKESSRVKLAGAPRVGISTAKTPETPRIADVSTKDGPPAKGKGRTLPNPEDNMGKDGPPPRKGKDGDPVPPKKGMKDDDPPAKKGPPPPKKEMKDDEPPAKKGPPSKEKDDPPPMKKKDRDDDPPPVKKAPPPKKDKDDEPPPVKKKDRDDDPPPVKKGPPPKKDRDDDPPPVKNGPPGKKDKD